MFIYVDGRPASLSAGNIADPLGVERDDWNLLILGTNEGDGKSPFPEFKPEGSLVKIKQGETSYTAEVAIPIAYLNERQGGDWSEFRLNLYVLDADPNKEERPERLFWRPAWTQNVYGTGIFERE